MSTPSRLVISVVLLVSSLTSSAGADPLDEAAARAENQPRRLVELGDLYVESHRLEEAQRAYSAALAASADMAEAVLGLARVEIAAGKFKHAKKSCRDLKKKDASGFGAICEGALWMSVDRTTRAVDEFRLAIKKGAKAQGKLGLADALRKKGDSQAALTAYGEAASAGAGYRALLGKGLVLEALGRNDEALAEFQSALGAQPASSAAHYHAARLLPPGPEAVALLEKATAMRPGWSQGLLALGGALIAAGQDAEAFEVLKKAGQAGGAQGAASFAQAQALRSLGRLEEAKTALKETLKAVPNHPGAQVMLARIHMDKDENDEALVALERARATVPGDVSVYLASGEIHHRIGRDTAARSFLKEALALSPKLSRANVLLGDIACSRRLYAEAKRSYQAALEGDMQELTRSQIEQKIAACKSKKDK